MKRLVLITCIFFISLLLRIHAIAASLNTDENLWMYRGSQFIKHLLEFDFINTYLKHHPGIPNMWLTGTGMLLNCWLHDNFSQFINDGLSRDIEACLSLQKGQFPIEFYILPRIIQAVVTSVCMVYLYILSKRLFGKAVALCAIILLSLEPFFLAYQRFITTDALQADFGILGLLLFLFYLKSNRRKFILASGLFVGLAIAAKVTAVFLVFAVILVVVGIEFDVSFLRFTKIGWKRRCRELLSWILTMIVVFAITLPAMWTSPGYVLGKMFKGVLQESGRGFFFFLGEITDAPGMIFYPLVLIYRLSPALQIGLLAGIAILIIPKLRRSHQNTSELTVLALTGGLFLLFLSLSSNKIDRYINFCLPIIALLAAAGWLRIFALLKDWMNNKQINLTLISGLSLFILQLLFLLPYYPYYLTYYNPLFGGAKAAQNIFMIGQGEGLETAARWLNNSSNVKSLQVASWYSKYFAAYFDGTTIPIEKRLLPGIQPWTKSNRVVLYINQFQRQLPEPKMLAYFVAQKPLYKVSLHGIDYVKVYPGSIALPKDLQQIQFPTSILLNEQVRLLGYEFNKNNFGITLYWKFFSSLPPDAIIKISWLDADGNIVKSFDSFLVDGYLPPDKVNVGTIIRDFHLINVPNEKSAKPYQLQLAWFSSSSQKVIGKPVIIKMK
ncbi:MAG: glycosyltransferase family 39 protein [Rivularia sp. (in: Bacteria)]|nr:glycosyltransferase family 39 protein [Rivularia sp. MS3]